MNDVNEETEVIEETEAAPTTYLARPEDEPAVRAFFVAAAAFHRAAPWKAFPPKSLIAIDFEGHANLVAHAIGDQGVPGLLLFASMEDFGLYLQAARGLEEQIPSHLSFGFESASELGEALHGEITRHGWEVAGPDALASVLCINSEDARYVASAGDYKKLALAAHALAKFAQESAADLAASLRDEEPVVLARTYEVNGTQVTVTAPHPVELTFDGSAIDALIDFEEESGEELDIERADALHDALIEEFAEEDIAKEVDLDWLGLMLGACAREFELTAVSVGPDELRTILLEVIPREVKPPASQAGPALIAMQSFFMFLAEAYELENAILCCEMLAKDFEPQLRMAFSAASRAKPVNAAKAKAKRKAAKKSRKANR